MTYNNKGFSEEQCVRCGWTMGNPAVNCQNDNTPHVFPSQLPPHWEGQREFSTYNREKDNAKLVLYGYDLTECFIKNTTLGEIIEALQRAGICYQEWNDHNEKLRNPNHKVYGLSSPSSTTQFLKNEDGILEIHGTIGDKHV